MECLFSRGAETVPPVTATLPRRRRPSRFPNGFHSVASAAALLGRATSGIYRDIELGRLRAHSWRGRLVVSDADLAAWLLPERLDPAAPVGSAEAVKSGIADHG
jgi:hypothetical protein